MTLALFSRDERALLTTLASCVWIDSRWYVPFPPPQVYTANHPSSGVQKVEIDSFSGYRIYPSKGKLFVRGDSKVRLPLRSLLPSLSRACRFSASPTARMSRSSSSARTPARSPGPSFTADSTRRVSQRSVAHPPRRHFRHPASLRASYRSL